MDAEVRRKPGVLDMSGTCGGGGEGYEAPEMGLPLPSSYTRSQLGINAYFAVLVTQSMFNRISNHSPGVKTINFSAWISFLKSSLVCPPEKCPVLSGASSLGLPSGHSSL